METPVDPPTGSPRESGSGSAPDGSRGGGPRSTAASFFLRLPLLHKILLANAAVVALGAVAGTVISVHVGRTWPGASTLLLASGFAVVGLTLSLVVNAVLVRWLLTPLERLEEVAARIQAGGEPVEEEVSVPAADPALERLVRVFNGMLRSLARHRRRLRTVAARSLEMGEEERAGLARALQEDTAQRVASCLVRLRWARGLEGGDRDRALDEVRGDLSATLEAVRGLARSLRPPELDDIGLVSALRALARETEERGGPEVRLQVSGGERDLPPATRLTLYRAAQAALRSCRRRGDDGALRLTLDRRDGSAAVELRAETDRLDVSASPESGVGGLELFAVRERARFAGGDLVIDRSPSGEARAIRVVLPTARGGALGAAPDPGGPDPARSLGPGPGRGR